MRNLLKIQKMRNLLITEATDLADGWSAFPSATSNWIFIYDDGGYEGIVRYKDDGSYEFSGRLKMPITVHDKLAKMGEIYAKRIRLSPME